MLDNEEENLSIVSALQFSNAESSIVVSESGRTVFANTVQLRNASFLIVSRDCERLIVFRFVQ